MIENYIEIFENAKRFETDRLILRKATLEDTDALFEYGTDKKTLEFLIWEGHSHIEQVAEGIKAFYQNPGVFVIELKAENKVIGAMDMRPVWEHEKAGFGYGLISKYWGKGYMSQALGVLVGFCFNELELNRVECCHYVGNEASGRVMEKCGMIKEGVGLQNSKVKGRFVDEVFYGVTRDNWKNRTKQV